jgi:hypothetical protein
MKRLVASWLILASIAIAGCGGSDNSLTDPGSGTVTPGPGPGGQIVEMGVGVPPNFNAGQIGVAVANLSAGGSTSLTVNFVTTDGVLFTESVDVTFSSGCISTGLANVSGDSSTNTGTLTVTYSATGCSGDDVVTATSIIGGSALSATGTVTVAAASVGSIEFTSANPPQIGLQGTGGVGLSETSTVSFRVVDSTGGPVAGTDVDFSLNTNVGGIAFQPAMAESGVDGRVQTVIQSGTVATSLRVTATVSGTNISTQSSQLIITTGLPDQNSVSLAVECANVEAFNVDGVQNPVTVRLADRFGNPVPDGTAVTLNTEGGKISGGCSTTTTNQESGVCTVNWTSQDPRPINGRSSIVATAIGEESFTDVNGNGFFDDGDTFIPEGFDLNEAFRDDNENGIYDPGEFFFDFDNDNNYTVADGQFSGLLCGGPTGAGDTAGRCSPSSTIGISAGNVIIMSGSGAVILDDQGGTLTVPGTVTFTIGDVRNQPMPAGTTVTASASDGRIIGPSEYEVPCTGFDGPLLFPFTVDTGSATPGDTGFLSLSVETPDGVVTSDILNLQF